MIAIVATKLMRAVPMPERAHWSGALRGPFVSQLHGPPSARVAGITGLQVLTVARAYHRQVSSKDHPGSSIYPLAGLIMGST
jgi:hypothetical protein